MVGLDNLMYLAQKGKVDKVIFIRSIYIYIDMYITQQNQSRITIQWIKGKE